MTASTTTISTDTDVDSWDAGAIRRLDSLFASIDRAIELCLATNQILGQLDR